MLSRIPPRHEVATIDCDQWVDPAAIPDARAADLLPLLHDGFDLAAVVEDQKREFEELRTRAGDKDDNDDSDYVLIANVLYSVCKPTSKAPDYPRLVLPFAYQVAIIDRAHQVVGHMTVGKTLDRLREAYYAPPQSH